MDLSISKILTSDKVQALKDNMTDSFESLLPNVLKENKGHISLRRKLNEYLTFNILGGTNHVVILKANSEMPYSISCSCKVYEHQNQCVHIAAVLSSVLDQLNGLSTIEPTSEKDFTLPIHNSLGAVKPAFTPGNSNFFVIPDAKNFSFTKIRKLFPYLRSIKAIKNISKYRDKNGWSFKVIHNYANFTSHFEVNEINEVIITCTCNQVNENYVCDHIDSCLEHFNSTYDNSFVSFLNKDVEKNSILNEYGLSLDDADSSLFKFKIDNYGNIILTEAPEYYVGAHEIKEYKSKIISNSEHYIVKQRAFLPEFSDFSIGLVFVLSHINDSNIPVYLEGYKSEKNKKGNTKLSRLQINSEDNLKMFSILPEEEFYCLMDFSFISFKNSVQFDSNLTYHFTNFKNNYFEKTKASYLKYFYKKIEQHWDILMNWENSFAIDEAKSFHKVNFEPIVLRKPKLSTSITVLQNDRFIILEVNFELDECVLDFDTNSLDIYNGRLIKIGNELYRVENSDLIPLLESMPKGKLYFPVKDKIKVMKEILLPLHVKYNIELPEDLSLEVKDIEMVPAIHFKEWQEKFLVLEPKFYYDNLILDAESEEEVFIKVDEKTFFVSRSLETENAFIQFVKTLHPSFKNSDSDMSFQIPFEDVMKNQWFINASKLMMDQSIKLVGVSELKKFRYNTATPKWDMNISSGIDWFDINIRASWGEESIGFKDIKKAILNGQSFVVLGDGSFGSIPEEWIQKYSYLFKISKESKTGVQLSKKHFGIIDLLFDQIDDEVVYAEIQEKKRKLLSIEDIVTEEVPEDIKANLRPYQESGYKWMQVLDEISWGGCLADDMGLGKTLQAITFLVYLKKKYDNPTSLIICPTSLIYNWENELKKFAPSLRYYIFYGLGRTLDGDHFDDYDLIITSYGNARNDVESLMKFEWEYIILDESQAIKNPDANTTRAMQLLKARNKFILSGTPIQNNTYDLYAQFNFLNPGLLGTREFFRNEFANPIDKNDDKIAAQTLKTLIKPFLLRRTKSEVALDLPEKTESILWCHMEKEQKSMYDEYKDYFRHTLSQKIETDGIGRSGMYILEGLLRLRQICDDPRLIKDKDRKPIKGAKITELTREIVENTGEHKMLIFSQFTEMLALIKEELDSKKIKYCYLDGSTPASKRNDEVNDFQNKPEIKVFLISLKAGGVGLNLTAADYVYIVDPWWNPAVEQQAIDRTHRIGQKNNIFAYKMICKDSVEEKILLLQDKKRKLSTDLISEENAFFKKLTKEDIQFLFS